MCDIKYIKHIITCVIPLIIIVTVKLYSLLLYIFKKKQIIIAIEGNIGVGKTTFLDKMKLCKNINNNSELILGEKVLKLSYIIFSLMFILFVGGLTSLRYLSYNAPGFDFGIFTQMFNNMKTSFAPNTTCELDYISSHFAVHISPIYYIILPFYFLFPNPITLQIAQSVILASGLIPIYLLCRKFKLPNFVAFTIGICYCFYPALSGGCF